MKAQILSIGTELLLGDIVNTNAAYISKKLAELGIDVFRQSVVGDNRRRLLSEIMSIYKTADLIVTTGGLGPTGDDISKEIFAEYFGLELVTDKKIKAELKKFFSSRGYKFTPNNMKQAEIPLGATILKNDYGTAPGIAINQNGKIAVLLPGPPREMRPMFEAEVAPYLAQFSDGVMLSRTLNFCGIGESSIEDSLSTLMNESVNPTIAPYAKYGEVQVRITAKAPCVSDANALIDPIEEQIRKTVGDYIYGVDETDIASATVHKLIGVKKTLAVAESCTGGLLSKRITDIAGASGVFLGGAVTYSNEAKTNILGVPKKIIDKFGAVSEEVAAEMAQGALEEFGADIAVGITGIAGPDGGTTEKPVGLVYIGIAAADTCEVRKCSFGFDRPDGREYIRLLATNTAFEMIMNTTDKLKRGTSK